MDDSPSPPSSSSTNVPSSTVLDSPSPLRTYYHLPVRIFSSGLAGVVEICTFYPMDTIGKRLMYDRTLHVDSSLALRWNSYKQVILLNRSILSLFAGFKYAALYKIGQRTYQFSTQPMFKEALDRYGFRSRARKCLGHSWGEVWISASAGALMGFGELIFVPISVIKIRAQTHPGCFNGKSLYRILKVETAGVLWRGWTWTLARNVPGSFGLFGGDEIARQYIFIGHGESLVQHFASTFVGAVTSLLISAPFDVVKTRMQGGRFGSLESGLQILRKLLATEGVGGLFKGCIAKTLTIGPKLAYGMGVATYMSKSLIS